MAGGIGRESWGIRYQRIYGDLKRGQVWADLDEFLSKTWKRRTARNCPCGVSAWTAAATSRIRSYGSAKSARNGTSGPSKAVAVWTYHTRSNPTKNNRVGGELFTLGVDTGKNHVLARLKVLIKGPNYCHFPLNEEAGYDEQYFRGLTSEKAVVRFRKGRSVTVWEIKDASYKRNEPLDLRNYATAALEIANPVLKGPEETETERRQRATGRRRLSGGI